MTRLPRRCARLLVPVMLMVTLPELCLPSAEAIPAGEPAGKEAAADAKAEAPTLADLEKQLRQAMTSGSWAQAIAAVDALASTKDAKAVDVIIAQALRGLSYDVERHAGSVLAKMEDPAARAKIIEAANKNPNYKARIILIALAARKADDPAALKAVHAALKDPSKPVALTALQWIRQLKLKQSVEPLLAELEVREKKQRDRVYYDIRRALTDLTGVELEIAADWRNFWEAQKKGLSAPPARRESRTAVAKPEKFFGVEIDSDRLLFVIDVSGSMNEADDPVETTAPKGGQGEEKRGSTTAGRKPAPPPKLKAKKADPTRVRLYRVKAELSRVVKALPPSTRFGILSFNHKLNHLWESRTLKNATQDAKVTAVNWVGALIGEGATRTDLAMREALSVPEVDTIIVLTDGAPKDEKNKRLDIQPILAEVKELNRFVRARISTISFLQIRDTRMRTFCRELSLQNDGGEPHLLP